MEGDDLDLFMVLKTICNTVLRDDDVTKNISLQ